MYRVIIKFEYFFPFKKDKKLNPILQRRFNIFLAFSLYELSNRFI